MSKKITLIVLAFFASIFLVACGKSPDVRELKRQVLRMKRQIDLNEVVIAYRHAEFDLQTILANLGEEIAQAVSGQIFIDTGLPLAPHKPHHKKGDTNIKEKMSHD